VPPGRIDRLPQDLREATDAFDASELARETLGDTICDWYVRNKRSDWSEYRANGDRVSSAGVLMRLL